MSSQKGFVFDSTPSLPTPDVFAHGFTGVLTGRYVLILGEVIWVFCCLWTTV